MTTALPSLWDLIGDACALDGARTLHLVVGRPPMVRIAEEGLRPLDPSLPVLTYKQIQLMLSTAVEPERWNQLEQTGDGEVRLLVGSGRPITLTLFRNSDSWSAVVHL
jgi:Tfp pilus assembly pilus retraction ATPase PilT